jgi:hypothetical protein
VQVTAPILHTMGRLTDISPDMAELMVAATLHEASLGIVRLYPDCNMAKACQFEFLVKL